MSRRNFIRNSGTILATGLVLPGALSASGNPSKNQQVAEAVYIGTADSQQLFSGTKLLHLPANAVRSISLEKSYLSPLINGRSAHRFIITDNQGNCYRTHKLVVDEPGSTLDVQRNNVQLNIAGTSIQFEHRAEGKVQQQVKLWVMTPVRMDSSIAANFITQPPTALMFIS